MTYPVASCAQGLLNTEPLKVGHGSVPTSHQEPCAAGWANTPWCPLAHELELEAQGEEAAQDGKTAVSSAVLCGYGQLIPIH